eukprot:7067983-Prymnesium_polylepis.2
MAFAQPGPRATRYSVHTDTGGGGDVMRAAARALAETREYNWLEWASGTWEVLIISMPHRHRPNVGHASADSQTLLPFMFTNSFPTVPQ